MALFGRKKERRQESSLPDMDAAGLDEALREHERLVVDCWNTHCAPCRKVHPIMEELAGKYPDILFAKLNTDEHVDIAVKYGVMSVPTILFFRKGKPVGSLAGTTSKQDIESALKDKLEV